MILRREIGADGDFLFALFATSQDHLIGVVPPGPAFDQLVRMQYEAQRRAYLAQWGDEDAMVIEEDGNPIGRIWLHQGDKELRVLDVILMPETRGRGLGGALIAALCQQAAESGRRVGLTVQDGNRAQRLYERLGFTVVATQLPHIFMQWAAAS